MLKFSNSRTSDIDNIEILADPKNAHNILKPKSLSENGIENNDKGGGGGGNNQNNTSSSSTSSSYGSGSGSGGVTNENSNDKHKSQPIKFQNSAKNSKSCNNLYSNSSPPSNNHSSSHHHNNHHHHNSHHYNNGHHSMHHYDNGHKPRRKENGYNNHENNYYNGNGYADKNDTCFSLVSTESIKDRDFDFEQNLALFDKNAFYEEIEGQPKPLPSSNSDEYLNAYDSILKHLNINSNSSSSNTITNNISHKSNENLNDKVEKQIYHPISLANLFSMSSANKNAKVELKPEPTTAAANHVNGTAHKNYRFDEMVLDTGEPIDYQQIQIPLSKKRYVTDDGFVVPCLDYELRQQLFEQAYKNGFNKQRQIECMGRCCAEMALQLVGGPLRFSAKNNHQKPSILVLANSQHIQGAYAVCTARLLSIRNAKIYLFVHNNSLKQSSQNTINTNGSSGNKGDEEVSAHFQNEFTLFRSTDSANYQILNSVDEIKTLKSVDLILNGLDSPSETLFQKNSQTWYKNLVKHIDNLKASVLTIDPAVEGSALQSKWCITPVLPMSMSPNCGRVYLCDLGFTKNMFNSVNIKYQSPFGAKFLIPLHND